MSTSMNEQELLKNLAELPREIHPGRDPWPGISARIEQSPPGAASMRRPQRTMLMAVAASVVLALVVGLLLKPALTVGPGPSNRMDTLQVENSPAPEFLFAINVEYQAAFREFININESHSGLNSETVEKIEMTWADLRGTETALAAALQENPGDLFLNERMLELRARQLGFLKQLVTLDRNNRRLTI
jgi:hypothetical protein